MSAKATGQGQYLAALLGYYHQYREDYLQWVGEELPREDAITNYQRAWLAWYEARLRAVGPYEDAPYDFVRIAAAHYAGWEVAPSSGVQLMAAMPVQDPLDYLPPALRLNDLQLQLFKQIQEMTASCKELLLLSYYHRLSDQRLAEVLGLGGEASAKRRQCMLMVRERWKQSGLMDPLQSAAPKEQERIDHYFRYELDVEGRWEVEGQRSRDVLFRDAFLLREEWEDCIRLAGRQDLMETLAREESRYQIAKKATSNYRAPSFRINLPSEIAPYLIGVLLLLFAGLAFQTFAPSKEAKLFAAHYTELPPPVKTNDQMGLDLAKMLAPYEKGNFAEAYDELLPAANAYPAAPLYLGLCALSLDQPQRALDWFDQYLPGDTYRPYADWYSALAYLALRQSAAAVGMLAEITGQPNHPYGKRAADLLEVLE